MTNKFFWPDEIVSVLDNTITIKDGKQIELTRDLQEMLITDAALSPEDFLEKKQGIVMYYMTAAYAQPDFKEKDFWEGVNKFQASLARKRLVAIQNAMGLQWDTPEEAMANITYQDILRNIPKV